MGMKACEIFRDVDALFANYETNKEQFNNEHGSYNKYCPGKGGSKRCDTDYEKLNSILGYAYTELIQNNMTDIDSENDPSADFLVMALSHRLCKLSKNHSLSIKDAFKKYLKSHGGFNYSSVLRNKKYFNGSNIGIINCFYLAFKQICETINTYGKSKVQQDEYIRVIAQCYIIYDRLYNFVNQCSPYFQLLNHLKAIYDEFKKAVIKLNDNDQTLRSMLKQIPPIDKTTFGSEFNTIGCTKTHKKLEQNISRIKTKPHDEQEEKDEFNTLTELLGSDDENGDLGNKDTPTNSLNQDQNVQQGTPAVSKPASERLPPTPPQAPQKSGTSPRSGTKDLEKGPDASKNEKKGSGAPKENSDSEGGGSGSGTGSEKGGTKGGSESPGNGTPSVQNDQGGSSGGPGSQGDSSNQGGAVGGSNGSGDRAPSHSSGASNEDWIGNLGMNLNLTGYMPSVSGIYESSKNILTNTANQITSTYNSAKAIAQDTYDKTVSIAKDTYDSAVTAVKDTYNSAVTNINYAYTTSTNYISGAVSSITNQLSSLGSFSQLGDDQSGSGGSGNSLPADNGPLKAPQIPNLPQLPSSSTPPVTTTSPSPTSPDTAPTISQPQSGPTQDSSQITDQNGGSDPLQSHDTNPGTGISQTTNYSTDPPSTWNGSKTGTIVKINEKPSIWCIGSNKKCDILGIGIIGISIFVFLAIMYKYISFGSAKNSKKKKSMKRVIKFVDGNRKTQIIINSYDRNKDLKPIINSVDRKKNPTLNIYKLMQADPVPFINSFFLLIFFVYKKKFII
ncbi:CIR protein PIR protein [Plasmodium vinckei]|uniref:CIR protein PIR protein n=1 Tax=Plasmodium vinckei TaxID=5860 RepID=A0A6V7SDT8_PLAVN|nr:CIR protein PIR protein [Plasmodium vinckei]